MWEMVAGLFRPALDAFNGWRERKHEIKLKQHELKKSKIETAGKIEIAKAEAEIEAMHRRASADINWELESIRNSGWRDDGLTAYTIVLLTALFLPWTQGYVIDGFEALQILPMWFQVLIGVVYGSAFGVRVFANFQALVKTK